MGKVKKFPLRGALRKEAIEVAQLARDVMTDELMEVMARRFLGYDYEEEKKKRRKYLRELQEFEDLIGGKHNIINIRGV